MAAMPFYNLISILKLLACRNAVSDRQWHALIVALAVLQRDVHRVKVTTAPAQKIFGRNSHLLWERWLNLSRVWFLIIGGMLALGIFMDFDFYRGQTCNPDEYLSHDGNSFSYEWYMWSCRPLSSKKVGTIWGTPLNVAMTTFATHWFLVAPKQT